jgi:hypothetical protein
VTGLQIGAAELDQRIPGVLRGSAVVALVPAADDRVWAAGIAWAIARAAAAGGRRTALVDCFADEPTLHQVAGAANVDGIVDAFEYGASLNRIAQQQPEANLYFIPAGTFAPDAQQLVTHPRWRRLSAGFRHEEALLLLYVAAEHVATLAAEPDGMIVIAPEGLDTAVTRAPAVAEAVGRGAALLAVVAAEGGAPAQAAAASAQPAEEAPAGGAARPSIRRRGSAPMAMLVAGQRRSSWVGWVAAALIMALGVAGYVFRADLAEITGLGRLAPTPAPAPGDTTAPAVAPHADTLGYVVQVSAWSSLRDAYVDADSLEQGGTSAIVVLVELPRLGRRFRVYAGPLRDASTADSVLGSLRTGGWLRPGEGAVAALPLSFALAGGLGPNAAQAERAKLRTAGVPCFILGQADGTYRLFAGAYETVVQAAALQTLLSATGSAAELVPRVGFVP